ncbi:UxaA family hydrolase [Fusobacterium sp. SYSU M8D902]|uniref:UxaA family hydrolase n=1 Tax=Fusobacterium sp. SYSU M8D902 TaxID=3159562 RepID=UPI0032E3C7EB
MKINAVIIDKKDNVAVAIEIIKKGEAIFYKRDNEDIELEALTDIQIYHKLANKEIKKGEPVIKYGEHIGIAARDIKKGEHVHVHNVESHREEL